MTKVVNTTYTFFNLLSWRWRR